MEDMLSMLEQEKRFRGTLMTTESCDRLAQTEENLMCCLEIIWKNCWKTHRALTRKLTRRLACSMRSALIT